MDPRVKLVVGVLYPSAESFDGGGDGFDWFGWTVGELGALWGGVEFMSASVPFTRTDYYRDIAPNLSRRFVCFEGLFDAGGLPEWKKSAIAVEAKSRTPRIVNVDPGYVDGARLVLASTQDHAHRIYLRDGIFAEVTMRFRFGKWVSFDYTFPDFASGVYDEFLSGARLSWLEARNRADNGVQGSATPGGFGRSPKS
jgi:hypothetical protein